MVNRYRIELLALRGWRGRTSAARNSAVEWHRREFGGTVRKIRSDRTEDLRLFFIQIFAGNIVFRYLVCANFLPLSVSRSLHTLHNVGLERVSFLE
jgi:hypothetical protein